ncbi:MAG TPA: universal stress protein [Albitalea sp.]
MTDRLPVLAATDFSAAAHLAAERAARLAQAAGSALTLMHVLPGEAVQRLREWLGSGQPAEQCIQTEALDRLQRLAHELHAVWRVPVRPVLASGAVLDELVREADTLDAALLVLGARGEGYLRRLVLGTTSERLLRRTTRPVLVVRRDAPSPYRRALVAVDFSPWSLQSIAVARGVAARAPLVLVHAFQVPFEDKLRFAGVDDAVVALYRQKARADATHRLHALAHVAGLNAGAWTPRIVEGDASRRIVEQEVEQDCDLVVLGKHGCSATQDLLLGSVTKHVLAEGSADVLVSAARDA